ncbi:Unannotated [Lentimonas sp. CC19]|nr:Unannotated [Lentimonas sp. CC4]CAA6687219.1 Unannotated [Lentimonas sp. CC6]CAA6696836.1 Unannotated [Lentimonas sp. CC10]CAA6697765.1 Unannotated [Lentimonas sp. CC19]CAA7071389.1 Unannotated [Lentimonas sp. CC11]CAA7171891.1 Unannotated [Lentimonas sp. CC21]CAA7182871.1 Unannotated [Lentimonas sp. CC8]
MDLADLPIFLKLPFVCQAIAIMALALINVH